MIAVYALIKLVVMLVLALALALWPERRSYLIKKEEKLKQDLKEGAIIAEWDNLQKYVGQTIKYKDARPGLIVGFDDSVRRYMVLKETLDYEVAKGKLVSTNWCVDMEYIYEPGWRRHPNPNLEVQVYHTWVNMPAAGI